MEHKEAESPATDVNLWVDVGHALLEGCRVVALAQLNRTLGRVPTLEEVDALALKAGTVYMAAIEDAMSPKLTKRAARAFQWAKTLVQAQGKLQEEGGTNV